MYLHRTLWYPLTLLSPTPSTFSAMRTPDVQIPGLSASLVDSDETLIYIYIYIYIYKLKLNSVALVRERTIPTERPPPVGEVSANFCG